MDHLDPKFDEWLNEHEAEATRVKRLSDWRERQASDLLLNVQHVRILVGRARNNDAKVDSSEIEALVEKIKDLRGKIRR